VRELSAEEEVYKRVMINKLLNLMQIKYICDSQEKLYDETYFKNNFDSAFFDSKLINLYRVLSKKIEKSNEYQQLNSKEFLNDEKIIRMAEFLVRASIVGFKDERKRGEVMEQVRNERIKEDVQKQTKKSDISLVLEPTATLLNKEQMIEDFTEDILSGQFATGALGEDRDTKNKRNARLELYRSEFLDGLISDYSKVYEIYLREFPHHDEVRDRKFLKGFLEGCFENISYERLMELAQQQKAAAAKPPSPKPAAAVPKPPPAASPATPAPPKATAPLSPREQMIEDFVENLLSIDGVDRAYGKDGSERHRRLKVYHSNFVEEKTDKVQQLFSNYLETNSGVEESEKRKFLKENLEREFEGYTYEQVIAKAQEEKTAVAAPPAKPAVPSAPSAAPAAAPPAKPAPAAAPPTKPAPSAAASSTDGFKPIPAEDYDAFVDLAAKLLVFGEENATADDVPNVIYELYESLAEKFDIDIGVESAFYNPQDFKIGFEKVKTGTPEQKHDVGKSHVEEYLRRQKFSRGPEKVVTKKEAETAPQVLTPEQELIELIVNDKLLDSKTDNYEFKLRGIEFEIERIIIANDLSRGIIVGIRGDIDTDLENFDHDKKDATPEQKRDFLTKKVKERIEAFGGFDSLKKSAPAAVKLPPPTAPPTAKPKPPLVMPPTIKPPPPPGPAPALAKVEPPKVAAQPDPAPGVKPPDKETVNSANKEFVKERMKFMEALEKNLLVGPVDLEKVKAAMKSEKERLKKEFGLGDELDAIIQSGVEKRNGTNDAEGVFINKLTLIDSYMPSIIRSLHTLFDNTCREKILGAILQHLVPAAGPPAAEPKPSLVTPPEFVPPPPTGPAPVPPFVTPPTAKPLPPPGPPPTIPPATSPAVKPSPSARTAPVPQAAVPSPATSLPPKASPKPLSETTHAEPPLQKKQFVEMLQRTAKMDKSQFIHVVAQAYGISAAEKSDSQLSSELGEAGVNVAAVEKALETFQRIMPETIEKIENAGEEDFNNSMSNDKLFGQINVGSKNIEIGFFRKLVNKICNFFNLGRSAEATSLAELVKAKTTQGFDQNFGKAPLIGFPERTSQVAGPSTLPRK
jgi:hypothetical protein